MKVKCPECDEQIEVDKNEVDENDTVECSECGEESIVKIKKGKIRLASQKEKYFEEGIGDYSDD
ncbi:MAG: hypothetical protein Q7K34_03515 [archaeon]|nr:hypothetical protein [archaeon]